MSSLADTISLKKDGFIVPIGDLREIWTEARLREVVGSTHLEDHQIQFAQDYLIRTISMMAYLEARHLGPAIVDWTRNKVKWDERLHEITHDELAPCLLLEKVRYFKDVRKFFVAVILTDGEDTTLQPNQVMPLIGNDAMGDGQNGVVTGHEIPKGHLIRGNRPNSNKVFVAKKTLIRMKSVEEITILKTLRGLLLNKNIPIATCISLVTEELLVHSLSDRSPHNLEDKLKELNEYRVIDRLRLSDSIIQVRGIAEAVKFLHNNASNGPDTCFCHMDIKPSNILVYNSSSSSVGKWKIIDFGITTMSDKKPRKTGGGPRVGDKGQHITVTVGTHRRQLEGRYQPPEINRWAQTGENKYMGRGSDVWSLACVFSEVLAANLGELFNLREQLVDGGSREDFFYEKRRALCTCQSDHLPCLKHRRNPGFDKWLKEKGEPTNPILERCKALIKEMTEVKRIRRLKSEDVVRRIHELVGALG
ncbi:kinase-like domain-containing protein [Nemania abortiva]|nr:kinase-like domain-containing protein [Nemania abortiva]